jgi:hypothetical protein
MNRWDFHPTPPGIRLAICQILILEGFSNKNRRKTCRCWRHTWGAISAIHPPSSAHFYQAKKAKASAKLSKLSAAP